MIRGLHLVGPGLGVVAVVAVLAGCITDVGEPAASTTTPSPVAAGGEFAPSDRPAANPVASPAARSSAGTAAGSPPARSAAPRPGEPDVPSVAGYAFDDPPPAVKAGVQRLCDAAPDVFGAPAVRDVRRGRVGVGSLALVAIAPQYVGRPEVETSLVDGLVKGMAGSGYRLTSTALHGRRVVIASAPGSTILAWYDAGVVALFLSDQGREGPVDFADAFLAS